MMKQHNPGTAPSPKLRVLALHSFRTSAKIFSEQFRRAQMQERVGDLVEVVYMDAPNPASGKIPRDVAPFFEGPYYEWFTVERMGDRLEYDGDKIDAALASVVKVMREQGPFDGVVGFSQGTVMASTLVALQQYVMQQPEQLQPQQQAWRPLKGIPPLKFCVLYAGIRNHYPEHKAAWSKPLQVPSLHVFGDKDDLKPECRQLADSFENPVVIQHTRGHVIPKLNDQQLAVFRAFLSTFEPYTASNSTAAAQQPVAAMAKL